ncbi:MAG TPA: hypothetical protein VFL12_13790, partial [Thermoanaerobaculia bacterium]|nr:hypothetical protein [Thermoanaerobaculia bacterium]
MYRNARIRSSRDGISTREPAVTDDDRRRVLDWVKPLAVGIDGVTNFGDVERILRAAAVIAAGRGDVDPDRLFLLAV